MAQALLHRDGRGDPSDRSDYCPLDVVIVDELIEGDMTVGPDTPFFLVDLPEYEVSDIQYLTEEHHVAVAIYVEENLVMKDRRKWAGDPDKMPTALVNSYNSDDYQVTLTGPDAVDFLEAYSAE